MRRALVVYGSRHGATEGIALRVGQVLRSEGIEVRIVDAATKPRADGYGAYIVGSAVYMGSWLKEATEFLSRNQPILADRPVWLFSSGPLPLPAVDSKEHADDPFDGALGPESGPGSRGRRKIVELSAAIHPRGHRVFLGAFDPSDPPRSIPERLVRLMPATRSILPTGDFREWDAIEAWAREIARELVGALVAV